MQLKTAPLGAWAAGAGWPKPTTAEEDTSTQELLELNTFGQPPLFSFETSVPGQARKFAPVLSAFCFHADVFLLMNVSYIRSVSALSLCMTLWWVPGDARRHGIDRQRSIRIFTVIASSERKVTAATRGRANQIHRSDIVL